MLVQIYGVTTASDAAAVDRLGADHIGVVVDEGIDTWDSVDDDAALTIARTVEQAKLVALSLSTDRVRILRTLNLLHPAILHLARAHLMDDASLQDLREAVHPIELMLTVPVRGAAAIAQAQRLSAAADHLLLDSAHPETGVVGATGIVHDWMVSAQVVKAVTAPVILAGGLGPHNVVDAIRAVGPAGVDSETRTSKEDDRRRKDLAKVEAFVDAAKFLPRAAT